MRKRVRMLAAALAAALLLTVPALAAGTNESGVYDLQVASGYTLQMLDKNGNAAESCPVTVNGAAFTLYTDPVKFTLRFTGNASEQYVVFLLKDGTVPTAQNIQYIDQMEGGAITFTVYPQDMTTPGTYGVYVSSTNQAYTEVASFQVTDSWEEASYVLGDVNMDGDINSLDALLLLQFNAMMVELNETQKQAADVNGDGTINSIDALVILQINAGIIN